MSSFLNARRWGGPHVIFAVMICLVAAAIAPFAQVELVPNNGEGFAPLAAAIFTVIIVATILTSFLLFQRYVAEADRRLLALAATYLFTGLLFVARQLVAPGSFGEGTILKIHVAGTSGAPPGMPPAGGGMPGMPAGPEGMPPAMPEMPEMAGGIPPMMLERQASMWLWIAAHVVFPVGIALAMALRRPQRDVTQSGNRRRQYRLAAGVFTAVLLCATLLTAGLVRFGAALPMIFAEGPPALIGCLLTLPIVLPLAYWRARRRGGYDAWVLGALAASCADVVLTTMGKFPYTVGWFGARMLSIIAASVLLVAMVGEISKLYRRLAVVHERLTFQAAHDVLTGVLARGAVMERVEIAVLGAKHRLPSVVAVVDLDHLKRLNDGYGHLLGDRVLSMVAQRMRAGVRDGDIVGRYGGDEFVVVMPGVDYAEGEAMANRVLESIRTMSVDVGDELLSVSVTIGFTAVEHHGDDTVDHVIARADAALYEAKRRGRNQVVGSRALADGAQPPTPRTPEPASAVVGRPVDSA